MKITKSKVLTAVSIAAASILLPEIASAGTGGTEFDGAVTALTGLVDGGLGRTAAAAAVISAVAFSVVKFDAGKVVPLVAVPLLAVTGIGVATAGITALI